MRFKDNLLSVLELVLWAVIGIFILYFIYKIFKLLGIATPGIWIPLECSIIPLRKVRGGLNRKADKVCSTKKLTF